MLNLIRKAFDNRTQLQILANDRNLLMIGAGNCWTVLNAYGEVISTHHNQVSALSTAIFGAK